jgi:hypothetical protein
MDKLVWFLCNGVIRAGGRCMQLKLMAELCRQYKGEFTANKVWFNKSWLIRIKLREKKGGFENTPT